MPATPVCESDDVEVVCTTQKEMTNPKWELKVKDQVYEITNGSNSRVTNSALRTTVNITNIESIWGG